MRKYIAALLMSMGISVPSMSAYSIGLDDESLVADGIVRFVPERFDITVTPELILQREFDAVGPKPAGWSLNPVYEITDSGVKTVVDIPAGTSLYGGGEVTGPLLRNGCTVKMWNTDTGMYLVDGGKRLYQTHPWVMGVRPDGTAFGVLFDTFHRAEMLTADDRIEFVAEGTPYKTYIIDRESPRAVLKGLGELTGTIEMPPLWALGYHQCRFSYVPQSRAEEVARTFRDKKIPCDVMWFDINYMDGFRVFTVSENEFPDVKGMNRKLHDQGFRTVFMIDPGVKVDDDYFVYSSGKKADLFVKDAYGKEFHGKVWPGDCAFPDFTRPETRKWWSGLYRDFMNQGIDGIWNDMNEPSVFDGPGGTIPGSCMHLGGENLPAGRHSMWHNAYGRLMVEASREGLLAVNPDRRPFLLSRSNILGGQRYAAMWTGDNAASVDHMKLSVPMSLTLGLSGQPFNGPDIGGFAGNTDAALFGNWIGFGAFFPFSRGHASCDTNDKEPWAFGKDVERESRMALERRYRLMPYIYTAFRRAHTDGQPVMAPVFMADPADTSLRAEEQAFLIGTDLLVIPAFAENPALPKGIWEKLSLVKGDTKGTYQADLRVRGGSIIPAGRVVENTNQNPFEPLTLIVCPDADGNAEGTMYWDEGDGWSFRDGNYCQLAFKAHREGRDIIVTVERTDGDYPLDLGKINVEILHDGKVSRGHGISTSPLRVRI